MLVKRGEVQTLSDWVMALAVIAAFLLFAGGVRLARARESRKQGVLMIISGLVILMNVMIWTL
jgi:hypothetical protein